MGTYRPPPTYSAPGLPTEAGGCTFPGYRPPRTTEHTPLHAEHTPLPAVHTSLSAVHTSLHAEHSPLHAEHRPVARQPAATPAERAISATPAPEYSKNPKKAGPTPLRVKINR